MREGLYHLLGGDRALDFYVLRHSLVYSSTTGIIFSLLPSSVRSISP